MKKWLIFVTAFVLLLLTTSEVAACEPCMEVLTPQTTAVQADLVILGQKIGDGPDEGEGPDWITVRILEVLKGESSQDEIRVNSWTGMCPYGILIDDSATYLIFLAEQDGEYDAVNYGCAAKRFLVQDNTVELEDHTEPLADFLASLELEQPTTTSADELPKRSAAISEKILKRTF